MTDRQTNRRTDVHNYDSSRVCMTTGANSDFLNGNINQIATKNVINSNYYIIV